MYFRKFGEIQPDLFFSGDVDPEWVESLNSVLDDNRLLTLPSGWRIQFGPNVNFIFETHDLSYASPATISRMGMIFLSDEDVDSKAIISSWLAKNNADDNLKRLMDEMFIELDNFSYLILVGFQLQFFIRVSDSFFQVLVPLIVKSNVEENVPNQGIEPYGVRKG